MFIEIRRGDYKKVFDQGGSKKKNLGVSGSSLLSIPHLRRTVRVLLQFLERVFRPLLTQTIPPGLQYCAKGDLRVDVLQKKL